MPVTTAPIEGVIMKMFLIVDASNSLSGTLRWVTTTATSFPLRPTEVMPLWLIALKAYSVSQMIHINTKQTFTDHYTYQLGTAFPRAKRW